MRIADSDVGFESQGYCKVSDPSTGPVQKNKGGRICKE